MASNQTPPEGWEALAPPIPNFAHQSSTLPRVPLPRLEDTLQRLKRSLHPFAHSPEEFAAACRKIDEFNRPDGLGPVLQQTLHQLKNEQDSWLKGWEEGFYLSFREAVSINFTPYAGFGPQPAHLPQTPAARAAVLTYATMLFRHKLRSGTLEPEKSKGFELCMNAFRWMFDSCRIPGIEGEDWILSYAGSANPDQELGHVIVIRKNRFWKLKVQVGDQLLGVGDLIRQFQCIYDYTMHDYPAIGALTSQHRDDWAKDYALLSSIPKNASILREIQSSAFVVSLDDSTPAPESEVDISRALWHGTLPSPANPTGIARGLSSRYFDKPKQFIVFDNCVAGQMGEHSLVDGTHYFRLCDDIMQFIADPRSDLRLLSFPSILVPPEPLDFDLASIPEIHESMSRAEKSVYENAASQSLSFLRTTYGKAAIKSFGVSPDGWVQMVLQVAYARLYERLGGENSPLRPWPVGSLQTVNTRRFYKGRSETMMVLSDESAAFVREMLGNTATREEKVDLLREATKRHQQLISEAAMGEGIDNHLSGLEGVLPDGTPEPELFADELYNRCRRWTIFTSSLYSRHIALYGWSSVYEDGFGVAYVAGFDDFLQFTITSRGKDMPVAGYAEEIRKASEDLYVLFAGSEHSSASVVGGVHTKL